MIKILLDDSTSAGKQVPIGWLNRNTTSTISSVTSWRKFFLLFALVSSLLSYSCKDPDEIGLNILPPGDILGTSLSDTATILTITVADDSLKSDELSTQLIGGINDPVFGISTGAVYSHVNLEGTPVFINIPVADSLVLSLKYSGYYGDTNTTQTVNVYRLSEDFFIDSSYYANRNFSFDPSPLGTIQFQPQPNTKVTVGTDSTSALLRIRLSQTLADSLLLLYGQSPFNSNSEWLTYFKGLFIQPATVTGMNSGAISYFNFSSSKMTLYFHDTIQSGKKYDFSLAGARVNNFSHDYTGTTVGSQLNDATYGDSLNYVQPMNGVKTRISFPYLNNYISSNKIIINKAELSITVKPEASITQYLVPANLLLITRNAAGAYVFPIDYYESSGYFGGNVNADGNNYKFNITRQLQRYLDGTVPNADFDLVIAGTGVIANRVIIGSGKNADYKMKLTLYYTKIN